MQKSPNPAPSQLSYLPSPSGIFRPEDAKYLLAVSLAPNTRAGIYCIWPPTVWKTLTREAFYGNGTTRRAEAVKLGKKGSLEDGTLD